MRYDIWDMQYFLYARKSTDVEDKQVMSIEAQLIELRALARRDGLEIIEEFIEKQSAKMPGRPVFEEMLQRIEKGDAQGIICWKIDRLSRNPVDSGRISWLLQQGAIQNIRTHDRSYLPQDNVLVMSVEFGMANQYIRDLSVNVARGLRHKARQGYCPGQAPLGYRNDPSTKTIVVDRKKSRIVREAFELYAKNTSRMEDVARFLFECGIFTKPTKRWENGGSRPRKKDQIKFMLSNLFYYGHFKYCGEIYEGKHEPIISKELFDRVQKVLAKRCKVQVPEKQPQALCGLLKCGYCGCSITAEVQTKKSGRSYIYYHCTKKRGQCSGEYIRQEELDTQLSDLLVKFVMPKEWANELQKMTEKDEKEITHSTTSSVQEMRAKIAELDGKIARITDLFVEQDIERDEYLSRKRQLMSEKKSLQERILLLERNQTMWLEPMRKWLNEASMLDEIANSKDLPSKKSSLQKIFGSNLTLHAREARGMPQNQWFSLAAAKENQQNADLVSRLVPWERLELSIPCENCVLNAACLPVPPPRQVSAIYQFFFLVKISV